MMALGSPAVGLVFLIVLKTFVDIKSHLKQHTATVPKKADTIVIAN